MQDAERRLINDEIRTAIAKIEAHNPSRKGHAERVSSYAVATGELMGMQEDELLILRFASALHDTGKLKIKKALLEQPGPISESELKSIRTAVISEGEEIGTSSVAPAADLLIEQQYERWDSKGPRGLSENSDVALGARVIFVATAFDVMRSDQPWRAALSEDEALLELQDNAGTQFDPSVVKAFLRVQPLIQPIRDVY